MITALSYALMLVLDKCYCKNVILFVTMVFLNDNLNNTGHKKNGHISNGSIIQRLNPVNIRKKALSSDIYTTKYGRF